MYKRQIKSRIYSEDRTDISWQMPFQVTTLQVNVLYLSQPNSLIGLITKERMYTSVEYKTVRASLWKFLIR